MWRWSKSGYLTPCEDWIDYLQVCWTCRTKCFMVKRSIYTDLHWLSCGHQHVVALPQVEFKDFKLLLCTHLQISFPETNYCTSCPDSLGKLSCRGRNQMRWSWADLVTHLWLWCRLMHCNFLWCQPACQLQALSKHATSVAVCREIKLHILKWPKVTSPRHTCAIIMAFNQHLNTTHLWGGWILLVKEKCSPSWSGKSRCSKSEWESPTPPHGS